MVSSPSMSREASRVCVAVLFHAWSSWSRHALPEMLCRVQWWSHPSSCARCDVARACPLLLPITAAVCHAAAVCSSMSLVCFVVVSMPIAGRKLRVAVPSRLVVEPQRNSLGIPTLAAMLGDMCVDMSFVHEREQKVKKGDEGLEEVVGGSAAIVISKTLPSNCHRSRALGRAPTGHPHAVCGSAWTASRQPDLGSCLSRELPLASLSRPQPGLAAQPKRCLLAVAWRPISSLREQLASNFNLESSPLVRRCRCAYDFKFLHEVKSN